MAKRQRVGGDTDVVWELLTEAWEVLDELLVLYGKMPEDFLWDTGKFQTLRHPTNYTQGHSSREYRYIGRTKAEGLFRAMTEIWPGSELLVHGAKGSGKSTAVSSIVGYMLGAMKQRVVYICAARFLTSPVDVLQHALLVATGGNDSLASLTQLDGLINWCQTHRRDTLLFVVDEWDTLENFHQSLYKTVSCCHILVKVSSTKSREQCVWSTSDKPPPTFEFDGPYIQSELETWIAQSSLPAAKLEALDYLTGGMPLLLLIYEELRGDRRLFLEKIEQSYTWKLHDQLVALHTTKEELAAVVKLVTSGVRSMHLKATLDLTCFYKSENKLILLSPYLRAKAEYYIMEQHKGLGNLLQYKDIQNWAEAVKLDCIVVKGRNPARVGWNVEGLVLALMRYQGKLWDGLEFQHYRTYEHGCEAALLQLLETRELCEGVLVGPVAFSEKALDIIYLKLDVKTHVLTVKAVQIIVAKWKHKKSHLVWQEKVLKRWLSKKWTIRHQFIYVMPEDVTESDRGPLEGDLNKYIAACRTRQSTEANENSEDEEGVDWTEEYDGKADLAAVLSEPVLLKKLHECFSWFRRMIKLGQPSKLEKKAVKQCSGQVLAYRPCERWSCKEGDEAYYCCDAHRPPAEG